MEKLYSILWGITVIVIIYSWTREEYSAKISNTKAILFFTMGLIACAISKYESALMWGIIWVIQVALNRYGIH